MKLLDELFSITAHEITPAGANYAVRLHADSFIYRAHFPSQPITPGVCLVQMAKELAEDHLQESLRIVRVKNVKFLSVVSPESTPTLNVALTLPTSVPDDAPIALAAVVTAAERPMTKISFTCQPQ